jgi:hypothetical protein
LDDDNELFIDPRLVENSKSIEFDEFKDCLFSYFGNLIVSISKNNRPQAMKLMKGICEPFETRLGYGINNSYGSSIGDKLKVELLQALYDNPVLKSNSLNGFADMSYFLEGIGCDRISDFTTKVVKKHLIEFTQKQCNTLGIPMKEFYQKDIFDYKKMEWENYNVELPFYFDGIDDRPIIFVPKQFVRRGSDAQSDLNCFFRFARNYICKIDDNEFLGKVTRNGKNNSVLKKDFDKTIEDFKRELALWVAKHPNILDEHWTNTSSNIQHLTDDEISEIVYSNRDKAA